MSINETNGLIRFVPPPYLEGGYSVKVRVSDGYLSAEQDFTIHVMKETHENFAPRDLACGVGYNGSIPLSWMPPAILSTGAYGSLGLVFSHYTIYRSTNYSAGFTMLADSIISTTYNDVNCEAGRVYFYKVRAVYRVPYFLSNYSNTSSGVSLPSSLYYSTYIWHGVNVDGYLEGAEWERALQINLGTKAKVLIQNDERHMYIGLRHLDFTLMMTTREAGMRHIPPTRAILLSPLEIRASSLNLNHRAFQVCTTRGDVPGESQGTLLQQRLSWRLAMMRHFMLCRAILWGCYFC
jgi:hypothetical protein